MDCSGSLHSFDGLPLEFLITTPLCLLRHFRAPFAAKCGFSEFLTLGVPPKINASSFRCQSRSLRPACFSFFQASCWRTGTRSSGHDAQAPDGGRTDQNHDRCAAVKPALDAAVAITVSMVLRTVSPSLRNARKFLAADRDSISPQLYYRHEVSIFLYAIEISFSSMPCRPSVRLKSPNVQRLLAKSARGSSVCGLPPL